MRLSDLSSSGLRSLHDGVRHALAADDANPPKLRVYQVREHSDWKTWSDALEAELTRRGERFEAIGWENGNA